MDLYYKNGNFAEHTGIEIGKPRRKHKASFNIKFIRPYWRRPCAFVWVSLLLLFLSLKCFGKMTSYILRTHHTPLLQEMLLIFEWSLKSLQVAIFSYFLPHFYLCIWLIFAKIFLIFVCFNFRGERSIDRVIGLVVVISFFTWCVSLNRCRCRIWSAQLVWCSSFTHLGDFHCPSREIFYMDFSELVGSFILILDFSCRFSSLLQIDIFQNCRS